MNPKYSRQIDGLNRILYFIPILFIILLFIVNSNGCIAYGWALILFFLINSFLDKEYRRRNFLTFHFFLLLAIIVYLVNLFQFPHSYGMTSGELGSGTDDVFYYRMIKGAILPIELVMTRTSDVYFYSDFLRYTFPFIIDDPIKMIIMNVLWGICFLPYFTAKVAFNLTESNRVSDIAYLLITFCPFCWSGGLLIMRDVVGTVLILAALHYYLEKKYIIAIVLAILLFYIKSGFLVFLFIPIVVVHYIRSQASTSKRIIFLIFSIVLIAVYSFVVVPAMSFFTEGRIDDGELFRSNFVSFITSSDADSALARIYQQPIVLRLPLLILAFITIPMLHLGFGYNASAGFITPLGFMRFLYPIYFIFVSGGLYRLILNYDKKRDTSRLLLLIIVLVALGLGVVSLQLRHKAVLMPFLYIAIAYGYCNFKKTRDSQLLQIGYGFINIIYAVFL